nr:late embryogenesis abundant protein 6-like [Ipomoea trifida]GMC92754.1 late embryogenesis abundant protein 6-like [Ipomoea batatas]GMD76808.1 late embryogenesis abundant protein 6-like [Ipomoea batatas]GMD78274.1 late embryogenesis abundant protein 6-like [Ipomoea batatas]GMD81165.1 late embryogenesis abundant protein 6-like [Ipomoea batatas]
MNLHEAKARHAAEKLQAKQAHLYPAAGPQHHHHEPVGTVAPTTGAVMPGYPLGGYPHGHGRHTRNI